MPIGISSYATQIGCKVVIRSNYGQGSWISTLEDFRGRAISKVILPNNGLGSPISGVGETPQRALDSLAGIVVRTKLGFDNSDARYEVPAYLEAA